MRKFVALAAFAAALSGCQTVSDPDRAIYAYQGEGDARYESKRRSAQALIDTNRHTVIESAHPSPLSAHNGFFGSRPFSRANDALREPVDWRIPPR